MKKTILTLALLGLAASAHAEDYAKLVTNDKINVQGAVINSGSTIDGYEVPNAGKGLKMYVSGTAEISYTTKLALPNGLVVESLAAAAANTTTVSRTLGTDKVPFTKVIVSPTAGMTGTNALHVIFVNQ